MTFHTLQIHLFWLVLLWWHWPEQNPENCKAACVCVCCPGLPGTRKNIHSLTLILIINHPLSASSIYCNPQYPPCSVYLLDSLFAQPSPEVSPHYLSLSSY